MGLKAVANPAAGGQPGSFTTLTVSGAATIGGGLAVTGIQTINANSSSPVLAATQNGAGFALQAIGPSETQLLLTSDPALTNYYQIGRKTADGLLWFNGSQAGSTGYVFRGPDGEQMRSTASGLAVTGSISATGQVEGATLRVNVTPTAETPSATHTAVFNINGTNYKFLCLAA